MCSWFGQCQIYNWLIKYWPSRHSKSFHSCVQVNNVKIKITGEKKEKLLRRLSSVCKYEYSTQIFGQNEYSFCCITSWTYLFNISFAISFDSNRRATNNLPYCSDSLKNSTVQPFPPASWSKNCLKEINDILLLSFRQKSLSKDNNAPWQTVYNKWCIGTFSRQCVKSNTAKT